MAKWRSPRRCGPGCAPTWLGAALYVPEAWLTDAARDRARLPRGVRLQAKWRQALTLLRAGARQRPHRHRRAGRCGVWRYRPVSGHVASVAAPLCGGDFLVADRVPGAAAPRAPAGRPAGAPAHPARPGGGRAGVHGGPGRQGAAAVAAHQLAQPPRRAPLDGPVCGPAGDPGPRLARPPARPRGVAGWPNATRARRRGPNTSSSTCRPPPPGRSSSDSRISGGPSSSSTKS